MNEPLHLPMLFHYIGMINILISAFGVLINIRQAAFFLNPKKLSADPMRRKLGCSFLARALIYLMILILGVGINIELTISQWMAYNAILGLAMLWGIYASTSLYNHFRKM